MYICLKSAILPKLIKRNPILAHRHYVTRVPLFSLVKDFVIELIRVNPRHQFYYRALYRCCPERYVRYSYFVIRCRLQMVSQMRYRVGDTGGASCMTHGLQSLLCRMALLELWQRIR